MGAGPQHDRPSPCSTVLWEAKGCLPLPGPRQLAHPHSSGWGPPSLAPALGGGTAPLAPPRHLTAPPTPPQTSSTSSSPSVRDSHLCTGKKDIAHRSRARPEARLSDLDLPRAEVRASRSPRVLPVPPLGECERGLCVQGPHTRGPGHRADVGLPGGCLPHPGSCPDSQSGMEHLPTRTIPHPDCRLLLQGQALLVFHSLISNTLAI